MGSSPMPARLVANADGLTIHFQCHNQRGRVHVSLGLIGAPEETQSGAIAIDVETCAKSLRGVSGNVVCQSVETPIGSLSFVGDADCTPRDKGRLRDIMASEYVPSRKPVAIVEFESYEFRRALGLVSPCVDDSSTRYVMNAVCLDTKTEGTTYFVATDGRRLCAAEVSCRIVGDMPNCDTFIDPVAVAALGKGLQGIVHVHVHADGETTLVVRAAGVEIACSVCGRFPSWRQVVPTPDHVAKVNRRELVKALADCDKGEDEDGYHKIIATCNGACAIASHDGSVKRSINWVDSPITSEIEYHLDPTLLGPALAALTDPTVFVGMTDDDSAVLFGSELNRCRVIVMPMSKTRRR
jgi:DNA polymerase III sliding clamp (beta) subunit (PCNA family)